MTELLKSIHMLVSLRTTAETQIMKGLFGATPLMPRRDGNTVSHLPVVKKDQKWSNQQNGAQQILRNALAINVMVTEVSKTRRRLVETACIGDSKLLIRMTELHTNTQNLVL
jgi:hypothetical protein